MIYLLVAGTIISGITAVFNWVGKAQNNYNEDQKRKVAEENGFKTWDELVLYVNHQYEMEKQKDQQEWQSQENELNRQQTESQNALDRELKTQLQTQGEQHESAEAVLQRQHEQKLQDEKLAQEYYLQTNAKSIEYQDLKNAGLNPALMYGTSAITGNTQAPPIKNSAQGKKPESIKAILNSAYKEAITQKAIQEIKKLILKNKPKQAKKIIYKTSKQA